MSEGKLNTQPISEFDGSMAGTNAVEGIEKSELICRMCELKRFENVIVLKLSGRAFFAYH